MAHSLIGILHLEIPLYKELLSLLQEEKRLLCLRTTDELHQLSIRIEALVFKVKSIEKTRDCAVLALAERLRFDTSRHDVINLTKLLTRIDNPQKAQLRDLQSTLLALVASIEELNRENSIIIGRSIENIKSAFIFLKELTSSELYNPTGVVDNPVVTR